MNQTLKDDRLIRFSVFELDRCTGELFKQGRKVKLQGQPFELLVALLEFAGKILTREELRQRIWPSNTAGDFDHGLNRSINKVREALGDSAQSPRFIETIPRRGYRFIGSIHESNAASEEATLRQVGEALRCAAAWTEAPPMRASERAIKPWPRRRVWSIAGALLVLIGVTALLVVFGLFHSQRPSGELRMRQPAINSVENPVWRRATHSARRAIFPETKTTLRSGVAFRCKYALGFEIFGEHEEIPTLAGDLYSSVVESFAAYPDLRSRGEL